MESLLGVVLSEIKVNLCDAVGDDHGDHGDVHDIDDDDKQVAQVRNVEKKKKTFFGFSLPGAAGVECSMAREMGNTVIFSISPDLMRISVSP